MPTENKANYLDAKQPVPEPFEWVAVIGLGMIPRKEYIEMGYAGLTHVQAVGFKNDYFFPTYRITGESIEDIRAGIIKGVNNFCDQILADEAKKKI